MKKKYLHEYTLNQLLIEEVDPLSEGLGDKINTKVGNWMTRIRSLVHNTTDPSSDKAELAAKEAETESMLSMIKKKYRYWEIVLERYSEKENTIDPEILETIWNNVKNKDHPDSGGKKYEEMEGKEYDTGITQVAHFLLICQANDRQEGWQTLTSCLLYTSDAADE